MTRLPLRALASNVRELRRRQLAPRPAGVLHLIETGGPGGAERMLLDLARNLGTGYESTVGLLRRGWLEAQVKTSGLPCAMLDGGGSGDVSVIGALIQTIRERDIALLHAHEFYMSTVAGAVARVTRTPVVMTVHGRNYYPERRRRRLLYHLATSQAARVVAVSRDLQCFFCRITGVHTDRVGVVYNGIDVGRFSSVDAGPGLGESVGIPAGAPIVGAVGNLYTVKGHTFLIRAARAVLEHVPNLHVVILGRGELESALRAEAAALGIQDRVHLLGYRDDAYRWLGSMSVFALPSLSEGLPLSLLEAMAAGLPAVATDVGGIPEVVREGQTGFLVPPKDPATLADRLTVLLKDPARAADMGRAGRSLVEAQFSLERMATEYRQLYASALAAVASARR